MPTPGQCFSGCIPRAPIRFVREILASMSGASFPSQACARGSGRALAARLRRGSGPFVSPRRADCKWCGYISPIAEAAIVPRRPRITSRNIASTAGTSLNLKVTGNIADRSISSAAAGSPLNRAKSFSVVTSVRPFRCAQAMSADISFAAYR